MQTGFFFLVWNRWCCQHKRDHHRRLTRHFNIAFIYFNRNCLSSRTANDDDLHFQMFSDQVVWQWKWKQIDRFHFHLLESKTETVCDCDRRHIEWKALTQLCCHLHNCQLFFDATQNKNPKSYIRKEIMQKSDRPNGTEDRAKITWKTKSSNTNCRHNVIHRCRTTTSLSLSLFGIHVISHFCLASLSEKYSTFFIQSLEMSDMRASKSEIRIAIRLWFVGYLSHGNS